MFHVYKHEQVVYNLLYNVAHKFNTVWYNIFHKF